MPTGLVPYALPRKRRATVAVAKRLGPPPPPFWDVSNLFEINENLALTRYYQFRSFQADKVGRRRKSAIVDSFDKFMSSHSTGASGWEDAAPAMLVDGLCSLNSQGKDITIVRDTSCPHVGQCSLSCSDHSFGCTGRSAFGSLKTSFVSKLKRAYVDSLGCFGDWPPRDMRGYLVTVSEVDKVIFPLRRSSDCEMELHPSRREDPAALISNPCEPTEGLWWRGAHVNVYLDRLRPRKGVQSL